MKYVAIILFILLCGYTYAGIMLCLCALVIEGIAAALRRVRHAAD